ncbi:hypothetical protein IG631_17398 [Alternaria alternata]|nr:hypothetical protein IG631_17398 [Alternaria alternata]
MLPQSQRSQRLSTGEENEEGTGTRAQVKERRGRARRAACVSYFTIVLYYAKPGDQLNVVRRSRAMSAAVSSRRRTPRTKAAAEEEAAEWRSTRSKPDFGDCDKKKKPQITLPLRGAASSKFFTRSLAENGIFKQCKAISLGPS